VFAGAFFWAGYWYRSRGVITTGTPGAKQPVHAPDVVKEESFENSNSVPSGAVRIAPERQQVLGVRSGLVEKKATTHTLRILGLVAPDENRLFRLNASTELWIRKVYPPTTGSLVRRDEPLLAYYATNFLTAAQSYLYALDTWDRQRAAKMDSSAQIDIVKVQIRQAVESLQNLGVSNTQIAEMERTRKIGDLVDVRSPTAGFVLSRNASPGQWIGAGTEIYKIADLSRVWILADVYENEVKYFRRGTEVKIRSPNYNMTFQGTISDIPPIFDPSSRTLKVRLEAENPGEILRPDMFVDVELPVTLPPAIAVPADAVLDSGLKKTVFVDLGNGYFEPREVETGFRIGNQIEIIKGLKPGERIVISGTFMIDSESRLEMAAAGMYGTMSKDPVCSVDVSITKAEKLGRKSVYKGKTYYFSSNECKEKFEKNPGAHIKK